MPARSTWKGYLKLSLVSVPVKAFTSSGSSGSIRLNQLHDECHSRINYKKVCPIHGEVSNSEIVSGYEFAKGQYVVIDPGELSQLRTDNEKSIDVDAFVPAEAIDPVYHSGKTYYLTPDGPIGQKPYALIRDGMAESGLHAVAQIVLSGKEQLILIRPIGNLLGMTILQHDAEVKQPATFEDELVETETSQDELKLTKTLIQALVKKDFDIADYKDVYTEKLTQLIEAKVEGKELVSPPAAEEPQIINLMDALKESVSRISPPAKTKRKPAATKKKPARKMAGSTTARKKASTRKTSSRKKKSG